MTTVSPERVEQADQDPTPLVAVPGALTIPLPPGCPNQRDEETERWLERVGDLNPAWRFELGHQGELIVNEGAGGDAPSIGVEVLRQLANWQVAGGGGRVRDSSGRYWVPNEDGDEALLLPDVSWATPAQHATRSPEERRGTSRICPAFVVEVVSPRDSLPAQRRRMAHWVTLGIRLGWLIDAKSNNVWVYRPGQEPERLIRPETLSGEDVLVGLVVDCRYIWQMADDLASL